MSEQANFQLLIPATVPIERINKVMEETDFRGEPVPTIEKKIVGEKWHLSGKLSELQISILNKAFENDGFHYAGHVAIV